MRARNTRTFFEDVGASPLALRFSFESNEALVRNNG